MFCKDMIPDMDRPSLADQVERLARDAAELIRGVLGGGVQIYWFGSWVTGQPVERSDIDLAVDLGRELTGVERSRIRDTLEELPTLRKIDILDLRSVGAERRNQIIAEGREL